MLLKSLKISGFKSFAKPAILNFPRTVSAIVGPNGSGKSNVAEAMAWVLGEQSMKSLRGKKGEDLIFNGSVGYPAMNKASVSLTFFDKESGDEVTLSRTVYRDGLNEYFINGAQRRLKDVVDFLAQIGIGTLRYYIISQGEADGILHASLKERKEMIEDALGLRMYQIKKEEGERKLEKTKENIKQVESLRREIRPHLRFLQKQADKIEEIFVLKETLKNLCQSYFSKIESKFEKDTASLAAERREIENQIEQREKAAVEIKEDVDKLKKDKNKIIEARRRVNELEREMGRYEGILSQLKNSFAVSGETNRFINNLERQIELALSEENLVKIKILLKEMKEKISAFFSKKRLEKKENGQEERYREIEKKYKELRRLLDAAKAEEGKFQKESEEMIKMERRLDGAESDLARARNALRSFGEKGRNIKDWHDREMRDLKETEVFVGEKIPIKPTEVLGESFLEKERREIEKIKIKIEESGGMGEEVKKEYEEIKNRDEFLSSQIDDLEKTADSLKDLIKQLEEKLRDDFNEGIVKINKEFKRFFELMFDGGRAWLVVKKISPQPRAGAKIKADEDLEEENSEVKKGEGLEVEVRLPGKKAGSLSMLSGGERALTSIALLFAVSRVNPPPFLILDETDAALDESNSRKYSMMLKDLSKKTQLVLITHNRETMSAADVLYGVTMGSDGVSGLLSVKLEEAEDLVEPTS
ncbi:MAG: hypothetical protein COT67_03040 [Candidatus Tagabacteria bacterium CG09_land_8_20_14_0_10_41_14]|uniref:AAA+ ATPase domain-containing protein n=2 Tax=Candidatus Tagaibacteriota TaxID=1817918 RepID=A0A2H0WKJ4_9BACT|nr:MAG: hypothetical protein COT67_03040 [Candidatus Tagabacteria bacterium CG09_land_8_20_14_0_10_41_14]PJE73074.1 MAG: hypothetical protein COV00_01895 [Candidatus Tagabacteria bacterium CG10_big_fil_rev_8_21_14_0_10_40_13]